MMRLSERQRAVLILLRKGFRNSEIGAHLGLRPCTVKWHVSRLFLIFEVSNRTELAGLFSADNDIHERVLSARGKS